jgi:hypothetical protein
MAGQDEEAALVIAAESGDSQAFEILIERHQWRISSRCDVSFLNLSASGFSGSFRHSRASRCSVFTASRVPVQVAGAAGRRKREGLCAARSPDLVSTHTWTSPLSELCRRVGGGRSARARRGGSARP